ncbi:hypothetical protein [Bacillus safensis]|uniref:hypothetical protein n=1 Tax=Bacillus safensis TaxID=561879 RepID=UPI0020CA1E19|nr:hypothetical protein [Bacillus safensis]MCP8953107.1 hypothetical protein [Bacillus safensis]
MFRSNKELKRNAFFYAGVGIVLVIIFILEVVPISSEWEFPFIFLGLAILFYLKFVMRIEEEQTSL